MHRSDRPNALAPVFGHRSQSTCPLCSTSRVRFQRSTRFLARVKEQPNAPLSKTERAGAKSAMRVHHCYAMTGRSAKMTGRIYAWSSITSREVLERPNQKAHIKFYLCLELFVFLFLLFQVQALDHHHGHTIIMIFIVAPPLGIVLLISWSL